MIAGDATPIVAGNADRGSRHIRGIGGAGHRERGGRRAALSHHLAEQLGDTLTEQRREPLSTKRNSSSSVSRRISSVSKRIEIWRCSGASEPQRAMQQIGDPEATLKPSRGAGRAVVTDSSLGPAASRIRLALRNRRSIAAPETVRWA